MVSQDHDKIIAQEQNVLASVKDQGEKLIPEFNRVSALYIRELSINLVKTYLKHKPEVSKNLGAKKAEEFKQEFTALLEALPEQTRQRLDNNKIWLHRVEIPGYAVRDLTYSYQFEKSSNKSMDDAIRELIGKVGSLLMNYGFVEKGRDFTWKTTPGGIILYANDLPTRGMDHYRPLSNLMEKYKDILIEYVFAAQNLKKAEQAKQAAETDN